MKIVSYNINGIRASAKNGIVDWIKDFNADIYCLQEVRADENTTKNILFPFKAQLDFFSSQNDDVALKEYSAYYNCGSVAGYAGTMILSKIKPDKVIYDMPSLWEDKEGRTTTLIFGKYAVVNTYVPNGNSRFDFKMQYLEALKKYLQSLMKDHFVICMGDFNIAHNEIDLTNPKECRTKSVFLPIERQVFGEILNIGLVDSYRFLYPSEVKYSWRSYRSVYDTSYNSWKYRIDYIIVSEGIKHLLTDADILDLTYSDHLPCVMEIDI